MGGRNLFTGSSQYNRYTNVIIDIIKYHSVTLPPMKRLKAYGCPQFKSWWRLMCAQGELLEPQL